MFSMCASWIMYVYIVVIEINLQSFKLKGWFLLGMIWWVKKELPETILGNFNSITCTGAIFMYRHVSIMQE